MRRTNLFGFSAVLLGIIAFSLAGCQQVTKAPQAADTQQETAAQGSQVNIWFSNGTESGSPRSPSPIPSTEALDDAIAKAHGADGQDSQADSGGYVLAGRDVYVTINTGSTTPSQAASSTGTQTVSPKQQPEGSLATDIAAGQTVNADQAATSGQGPGTVSSEKQSQTEQRIVDLQAEVSRLGEMLKIALEALDAKAPETQPAE
jgi:hypothetical protein